LAFAPYIITKDLYKFKEMEGVILKYKGSFHNINTSNHTRIKKKPISLRRRLLLLIVISWILPVIIIFSFIILSYRSSIINKTEMLMETGLKNFSSFVAQQLDEAITITKKTSYELIIEKAWKKYEEGTITSVTFYKEVIGNLKSKFYNDNRFIISVFYLCDEPDNLYYTSRNPNSYINIFNKDVKLEALKITAEDTSDAFVKVINEKVYIIRNLYTTTNYTKFGTLVVELNKSELLEGMDLNEDFELGLYINDTNSIITNNKKLKEKEIVLSKLKSLYSISNTRKVCILEELGYTSLLYQQKFGDYHIGGVLVADRKVIYSELNTLYYIMILILSVIIPIFIFMVYFISKHISEPMSRMIRVSREIEMGKLGVQVEGEPMPNAEFDFLMEGFNKMSSEVKYLFDYAYNEKLARKDAKILALQSQINPHFLNNTLEMMNWQARMAGDEAVSKMIEALGTLLDYSMNRYNKKMIVLAEELKCADAYLYIISMRFGQRLKVEKDVNESIIGFQVPQLILQPILENAVIHGIEKVKSGIIRLRIYKSKNHVYLQVINSGIRMTEDDMDRVKKILDSTSETVITGKGKHVSLGIRNVNERIKLIYGSEYGLTIMPNELGDTVSTIKLPYEREYNQEKEEMLKDVLENTE
jgi:two-component system sensor histidine kinase YesM